MANIIQMVLKAVDQASKPINDVNNSVKKLDKSTGGVNMKWTELTSVLGLAKQAFGIVKDVIDQTVGAAVIYNKGVREMTQVLGLNADETSRLIQVGDDWGISMDAIRTSLAFMNKTGITPSIDNLAKMADEYVNSADKAAWAEKAVKTLGRGYQTLIPLLALGGDGLRKATAAIEENLIVTDEAMAASRKYEVAVDDLTDAFTGLKYQVGNEVIPVLVTMMEGLTDQKKNTEILKKAQEDDIITMTEYGIAIRALRNGGKEYDETLGKILYSSQAVRGEEIRRAQALIGLSDATLDNTGYVITQERALNKLVIQQGLSEQAILDQVDAMEILNNDFGDLNTAINSNLGPTIENFIISQGDLEQQMIDIQTEMSTTTVDKLPALQTAYNNLKEQYTANADEHDKATKRIMYDMILQEMSVDGLTAAEIAALTKLATSWGLPYEATIAYMENEDAAINWLKNHPGDTATFQSILENHRLSWATTRDMVNETAVEAAYYRDILLGLDGVIVDTWIHQNFTSTGRDFGAGAHSGANFVVPPGYPNDTYPLNVESGEHVIVIPKGGNTNSTSNFTMNVHTNAPYSTLMRDFNMMKAMAG